MIFYGSNSWNYTKLGHVDDMTGWEEALGSGDVTVKRLLMQGSCRDTWSFCCANITKNKHRFCNGLHA